MHLVCNLKKILIERNMTQLEISKYTKISQSTISKLCREGELVAIRGETIKKLCEFLKIKIEDLLELK